MGSPYIITILKVDGTSYTNEFPGYPGILHLDKLMEKILGAWPRPITGSHRGKPVRMWVGNNHAFRDLDLNPAATKMYREAIDPSVRPSSLTALFGPVVVIADLRATTEV